MVVIRPGTRRAWSMIVAAMMARAVGAQPVSPQPEFVNTLMPQPAQLTVGEGWLPVARGFSVSFDKTHDERLDMAVQRDLRRLENQTGIKAQIAAANAIGTLTISVDGPGDPVQGLDEDESYALEVTSRSAHLH